MITDKRHHRFNLDGTWDQVLAALQAEADAAGEQDEAVSADSSISWAHHHGTTAARCSDGASSYTAGTADSQAAVRPRSPRDALVQD